MNQLTPAQCIMGIIVFYFLYFYVVKYIGQLIMYKYEIRQRRKGPPRAHYPPLRKPSFINIKIRKS